MKKQIAVMLSLLIAFTFPAAAGQKAASQPSPASGSTLSVRPVALGPLVENQSIKMMLKDGTYIEGKVLAAMEDILMLNVKHSEPQGRLKKGESPIQTRDISVVYMKKNGPIALPIILGVAGGFGGLLAGTYAGYQADSYGATLGMGIGLAAAGATGGAYLGSEAAKRTVTINVTTPKPLSSEGTGTAAKD